MVYGFVVVLFGFTSFKATSFPSFLLKFTSCTPENAGPNIAPGCPLACDNYAVGPRAKGLEPNFLHPRPVSLP